MQLQEFPPIPALAPYIQTIWHWTGSNDPTDYSKERIVPDGIVELVIHYGSPFATYDAQGNSFIQPQSFVVSQMKNFIEIQSQGNIGLLSVRFYPWGAYHFFKTRVKEFLDSTLPVDELWRDFDRVQEQIRQPQSIEHKVTLVQQYLLTKLNRYQRSKHTVDKIAQYIRSNQGQILMSELSDRCGFTQRHLARLFNDSIGTSPKLFTRITRFLSVCHQLEQCPEQYLTQLCYDCGYYDQATAGSHFWL